MKPTEIGQAEADITAGITADITADINPSPRYTILLVDDSDVDRAIYHRFLQHQAIPGSVCQPKTCQLVEVATGQAALQVCRHSMPDVILLDYILPDMNGLEVLHSLQQHCGQDKVPVIVITGHSSTAVAVSVLKAGALDYLDKAHLSPESLHRAITTTIRQMEVTRSLQRRQQQQQLITSTALRIRQSLTLEEILQTTVDETRQLVGCDRVAVYQIQPDNSGQIAIESVIDPAFAIAGRAISEESFPQQWIEPYRQGRIRAIDNIYTAGLSQCHVEFLASLQVQASLIAPLLLGSHLWGLLIAHECQSPRHWHRDEIDLLAQLSTQVSIALQQSSLIQQLQAELQDRRRAEAALKASEHQLRAIFEAEPECVKVTTSDGILQTMNPAGLAMIEADSVEQVTGLSIADLVQPSQRQQVLEFKHQVAQGKSGKLEFEVVGLKGTRRWLESHAVPLPVVGESVAHVLSITRDITDRKHMEMALRESEEKLRLLIKYAPASIAMFDRDMHYISASQRWVDDYHLDSSDAIIGRSHYDIFPDIPTSWRQVHQRCLAGAVEKSDEDLLVRSDGTQHWLTWEVRPWYKANDDKAKDDIGGIIIFTSDITKQKLEQLERIQLLEQEQAARKTVEELLQQLEAERSRLEQILQQMPVGVAIAEVPSGKMLFHNHEATALLRHPLLNAATCEDYVQYGAIHSTGQPYRPDEYPMVRALLSGEVIRSEEMLYRRGDGTHTILSVNAAPILDASGAMVVTVWAFEDISDRKRIETELHHLNETLEHRVTERTEELLQANKQLQYELLQRERTERSRQVSEARFRSTFEDAAIGMALVAPNGLFLRGNDALCQLFGYSQSELRSLTFQQITHPDDLSIDLHYVNQVLADKIQTYQLEKRYFHKNGHIIWGSLSVSLVRDKRGEPLYFISQIQDISDRKRIEAERHHAKLALQTELARSKALFKASFDGIVMLNKQGDVVDASNRFAQMLGYSLEEVLTLHVSDWDAQWTKAELLQLTQSSVLCESTFETVHRRHDGSTFEVEISATEVKFEDEIVQLCICRDISKRKQAELELRENEATIRDLYNITSTSDLSFEERFNRLLEFGCHKYGLDHAFIAAVAGHRYEVVKAITPDQSVHPGHTFDVRELYCLEVLNSEEPICIEHAGQSKWCTHPGYGKLQMESYIGTRIQVANQTFGVLCFFSRQPVKKTFKTVDKQVLKLMSQWIGRELERQSAMLSLQQREKQFRESDRRWRSLLDNVQLAVVGLGCSGTIEYINPFLLQLTGFTAPEVLGKSWVDHFIASADHSTAQSPCWEGLEDNRHPHAQGAIFTKSGEERIIVWNHTLLRDLEGQVIGTMSIGEDITERHKLERMKAEFISAVSHELRTPLTSMQAALSLLVDRIIDPSTQDGQDVIQIASSGVDRLVRLVNDILDLERLESGKLRLEKQSWNPAELITIAVEQMQEMANQAEITLVALPQHQHLHQPIHVDGDRLLQVLINLLSNAIKFSPPGGAVTVSVERQDSTSCTPTLLFTIRDQGRGIPTNKLESIFERFNQVDASDSREKGGTGLGLAICRSIVQQHGGSIWAKSDLEQGSTFYFTLPLEEEHHGCETSPDY